jgi:uncharacterized protein with HEPN domain
VIEADRVRLVEWLRHIVAAIDRIDAYLGTTDEAAFIESTLLQDAVIRNLEIIGEAARNITRSCPEFVSAHPDLPLVAAWEMRNVLSHAYFKVDLTLVWRTCRGDVPEMRAIVERALDEIVDVDP